MPTIIYAEGFEHRTISANDFGGTDGVGIFDTVTDTGANANIVTTGQRTGNAALELSPDGTTVDLRKVVPGADPAVSVVSFYLKFTLLPVADSILFSFFLTAGLFGRLWFKASTGKFHIAIGNLADGADVGPVLTTGVYYQVDLRMDVSANPNTLDAQIDEGTNVQDIQAQAATTVQQWEPGQASQTTVWTAIIDDFAASNTSVDYPLGAHKVLGLFPNGDGTHNISGAGDFDKGDGTDILASTTDAWLEIDDWITGVADTTTYVQDTAGASTEYTEHTFDDTTEGTIWAVVGFAAAFSANAQVCLLTVRVVDSGGATVADIINNVDVSETVLHYRSVLIQQNPTQAQVNAYKVRIGLSGDVAPDPRCSAVMLQYVVPEAAVVQKSGADTLSVSVTEAAALLAKLTASDSPTVSLTEVAALLSRSTVTDTPMVSLVEVAAIKALLSASDTLTVSVVEAASLLIKEAKAVADSLGVSLGEAAALLARSARVDSVGISLAEVAAIASRSSVSDSIAVQIVDAAVTKVILAVADTLGISLTDAAQIVIAAFIAISDAAGGVTGRDAAGGVTGRDAAGGVTGLEGS